MSSPLKIVPPLPGCEILEVLNKRGIDIYAIVPNGIPLVRAQRGWELASPFIAALAWCAYNKQREEAVRAHSQK